MTSAFFAKNRKYIVVKDDGDDLIVFCRFGRRGEILVACSVTEARLFTSEDNAADLAFKLNSGKYGAGGWYVKTYHV